MKLEMVSGCHYLHDYNPKLTMTSLSKSSL